MAPLEPFRSEDETKVLLSHAEENYALAQQFLMEHIDQLRRDDEFDPGDLRQSLASHQKALQTLLDARHKLDTLQSRNAGSANGLAFEFTSVRAKVRSQLDSIREKGSSEEVS